MRNETEAERHERATKALQAVAGFPMPPGAEVSANVRWGADGRLIIDEWHMVVPKAYRVAE